MRLCSSSSEVSHRSTQTTCAKPLVAWKIAFHTTFHSFHDKFGDVAKNLERSRELLIQSASITHFQEAQDARLRLIEEFKMRREQEERSQMMTTINWLSSIEWDVRHETIQEKRREFPGTARWIFNSAPFCDWLRKDEDCSLVFWLYGVPGAGDSMALVRQSQRWMLIGPF